MIDPLEWLTLTVWGEARGENEEGMLAVAFVVMNRCRGGDVAAVVLKPWQFSFWNTDDPSRPKVGTIDPTSDLWRRCVKAATLAYYCAVSDPTRGCTSYLNPDACTPTQKAHAGYTPERVRVTIGRHDFFIA